eukprot:366433-Chlamydomonas_euryale.AAC.14
MSPTTCPNREPPELLLAACQRLLHGAFAARPASPRGPDGEEAVVAELAARMPSVPLMSVETHATHAGCAPPLLSQGWPLFAAPDPAEDAAT